MEFHEVACEPFTPKIFKIQAQRPTYFVFIANTCIVLLLHLLHVHNFHMRFNRILNLH